MKIYCVCGIGLGTSMMAKITVDKICKEIGIKADVEAIDAGSVKGQKVDIIVTTSGIAKALGNVKVNDLVIVDNFVKKNLIREKLIPVLEKYK